MSVQLHAPAALPPGKSPRFPLDRRLGADGRIILKIYFNEIECDTIEWFKLAQDMVHCEHGNELSICEVLKKKYAARSL
jgi:hypothetical protein